MKYKLAIFMSFLLISACSKTTPLPQQTPSQATSENTTTTGDNPPSSDATQSNPTPTQQPVIPNPPTTTQSINISDEEAKQIALNQMQGTITEFSRDFDDYIPKYEISIVNGDMEYEYEISAIDGSIIGYSAESIYN